MSRAGKRAPWAVSRVETPHEDRYVRRIKERDRWQWLLRRNFRRNFVPRKVAIAFRSGDKNWKSRGWEGTGRADQEKEREREEQGERREKKERDTPVMVHEKTNSVILFGRRAKPSVWRHTFPLSLISSPAHHLSLSRPHLHPRRSRKLDSESTAVLKYKRQRGVSCIEYRAVSAKKSRLFHGRNSVRRLRDNNRFDKETTVTMRDTILCHCSSHHHSNLIRQLK